METKELIEIIKKVIPNYKKIIQTHISIVVLTGEYVYKFKKNVNFGFLDFSTFQKRKFYSEKELLLNKRFAPDLYLGLSYISYDSKTQEYFLEGDSHQIIEYAVKMKEFPQDRIMMELLQQNKVTQEDIIRIAQDLAKLYQKIPFSDDIASYGKLDSLKVNTDENFSQTKDFSVSILTKEQYKFIKNKNDFFYDYYSYLFDERIKEKKVIECHGDLHSGNICLIDKEVFIFDCIEFNERFKNSDICADIAFLAMDLDFYGKEDFSNILIEEYLKCSKDYNLLKVLNYYKCYRAYVRGKVSGFMLSDPTITEEKKKAITKIAKRYFTLAQDYSKKILYRYSSKKPFIIMMSGFSGSGKSFIGKRLSEFFNMDYLTTDDIRKKLFSIPKDKKCIVEEGTCMYTVDNRYKVYDEMFKLGKKAIESGKSVVIDGTFLKEELRQNLYSTFEGYNIFILNVKIEDDIAKKRIEKRAKEKNNPSDAHWDVYLKQKENFEEIKEFKDNIIIRLDGNDNLSYEKAYDEIIKKLI
jgi:uncharacterized protein